VEVCSGDLMARRVSLGQSNMYDLCLGERIRRSAELQWSGVDAG
jgi:hypothetical protein